MASEHTKRCSTSLVIRETRIKITMRHHTHSHGYYQKRKNEKCWWGCREIGTLMHCWWQRQWQRFRGTIWWFLKMSNKELPHNPPIPRLGITQKKWEQTQTHTVLQCSQQHYTQQPKGANNPSARKPNMVLCMYVLYIIIKTSTIQP